MTNIMAAYNRLEMVIDEWKLKMERAPPTEEDAIPHLLLF